MYYPKFTESIELFYSYTSFSFDCEYVLHNHPNKKIYKVWNYK